MTTPSAACVVGARLGSCFQELLNGLCSDPLGQRLSLRSCCCQQYGKGWTEYRDCQLCPNRGSGSLILYVPQFPRIVLYETKYCFIHVHVVILVDVALQRLSGDCVTRTWFDRRLRTFAQPWRSCVSTVSACPLVNRPTAASATPATKWMPTSTALVSRVVKRLTVISGAIYDMQSGTCMTLL